MGRGRTEMRQPGLIAQTAIMGKLVSCNNLKEAFTILDNDLDLSSVKFNNIPEKTVFSKQLIDFMIARGVTLKEK